MSAKLPEIRTTVPSFNVTVGKPVSGFVWRTASESINWSLGFGDVLVPGYDPQVSLTPGVTRTLTWKLTPNGRAVRRVWSIYLAGVAGLCPCTISVNGAAAVSYTAPSTSSGARVPILITEDLASKTNTTQTLTLTVVNSSGSITLRMASVSCSEMPRDILDKDTVDCGVDILTLDPRTRINSIQNESLGSVFQAASQKFHRIYVEHARPNTKGQCWSIAATAYDSVLKYGNLLARKVYVGDTTGPVIWYFYCSASSALYGGTIKINNQTSTYSGYVVVPASAGLAAGFLWYEWTGDATWTRAGAVATVTKTNHGYTTGEHIYVDVSSDSSAIVTGDKNITVTGANTFTFACLNAGAAAGTLHHDLRWACEDMTEDSGLPGAAWQEFSIEFKSANAAGTFYVASVCAEETP